MLSRGDFFRYHKLITSWISGYFRRIEDLPVKSQVNPGDIYNRIADHIPIKGENLEEIIRDLDDVILPGMTHWQHPNFHAYFAANSSVESLFAEMVSSAMSAQCMIWATSPAAAELEQRMMEWMRDAMGLPAEWEGVIQDTASTASLVSLITARELKTDFKSNYEGVPNNLRVYCSKETHSSVEKAMAIAGMGRNNLVKIAVDSEQRLSVSLLEEAIKEDIREGLKPCAVVVALGTTGTLAIDPLKEIAKVASNYDLWLHIDAAYAGTALFLPEYRWMIAGIQQADSFVFNPHKWLFTNFDCTAYYVKDADLLIRTFEILPEYLKTSPRGAVNDYKDWGIALGRRFRALKLWFVLRSYGLVGIQNTLRNQIQWTEALVQHLRDQPGFDIVRPAFLNFFCFRLKNPLNEQSEEEINALNAGYLDMINESGEAYLSHTRIENKFVIRVVIGQTYVEQRHVDDLFKILIRYKESMI